MMLTTVGKTYLQRRTCPCKKKLPSLSDALVLLVQQAALQAGHDWKQALTKLIETSVTPYHGYKLIDIQNFSPFGRLYLPALQEYLNTCLSVRANSLWPPDAGLNCELLCTCDTQCSQDCAPSSFAFTHSLTIQRRRCLLTVLPP